MGMQVCLYLVVMCKLLISLHMKLENFKKEESISYMKVEIWIKMMKVTILIVIK